MALGAPPLLFPCLPPRTSRGEAASPSSVGALINRKSQKGPLLLPSAHSYSSGPRTSPPHSPIFHSLPRARSTRTKILSIPFPSPPFLPRALLARSRSSWPCLYPIDPKPESLPIPLHAPHTPPQPGPALTAPQPQPQRPRRGARGPRAAAAPPPRCCTAV